MDLLSDWLVRHRTALAEGDVDALAACFASPLQIVSATGASASVLVPRPGEWVDVLRRTVQTHRRLGVARVDPAAVEVVDLGPAVSVVRVQWSLLRGDFRPLYGVTAVYTLAVLDGRPRAVAVAHNEPPPITAALRETDGPGSRWRT